MYQKHQISVVHNLDVNEDECQISVENDIVIEINYSFALGFRKETTFQKVDDCFEKLLGNIFQYSKQLLNGASKLRQ